MTDIETGDASLETIKYANKASPTCPNEESAGTSPPTDKLAEREDDNRNCLLTPENDGRGDP
ncbi:MAG: hypothetical protein ACR2OA_17065 [Rubripirellula sp.]